MNRFQRYLMAGTSLMSLVFSAAPASTQAVFFTNGEGTNNWFTLGNWTFRDDTNGPPSSTESAVIGLDQNGTSTPFPVFVPPPESPSFLPATAQSLDLLNGSSLTIQSGGVLNITSGLSIFGSSLTVSNGGNLTAANITNAGTLTNAGTITGALSNRSGGSVTNTNIWIGDATNSGVLNNSGHWIGDLLSNVGTLTSSGTWAGSATNSGVLNNSGSWNGDLLSNVGTLTSSGTWIGSATNSGVLNNSGSWNGSVTNNSGGVLTNSGTWSAGPSSDVVLTNAGLVNSSGIWNGIVNNNVGGTFAVSGTSTVNGTFNNAGTIAMQNGVAGDTLRIGGNYVGTPGSRIQLDFSSQTAQADQVRISGSASGSTAVSVFNLTPLAPFTTGATVIQAGSIAPGAFTLANAQNFGTTTLVLLPQNGGATLALGTIPSVAGLSSGVALIAAQTIAFRSSDVVFDHVWEVRNSLNSSSQGQAQGFADEALGYAGKRNPTDAFAAFKAPPPPAGPTVRPAVWVKGWGDYVDQNGTTTINFGGQTFPQDLGFRQRSGGVLAGADALIKNITSADDALLVGGLLGYTNSHVDLKASPTAQNYNGGNVGAIATYMKGNWFTDLMFKTDILDVTINGGGISQSATLINYDVSANVGYKFDLPNKYYIEPTAGIEYVSSNFSGTTAFSPTTIALNDGDATRGRIGARVGTEFLVNGVRIEPSLLGYVYSIFSQTGNALVFNSTGITLPSDVGKVRGEIQAAVNFFNLTTGVSGFVRVDTRFGDNLTAGGVRAGLRYQM